MWGVSAGVVGGRKQWLVIRWGAAYMLSSPRQSVPADLINRTNYANEDDMFHEEEPGQT